MWSLFVLFALGLLGTHAYDGSRYDNVVAYWGQNSYGATHTDVVNYQQRIGYYCGDDAVDVFPVAFVDIFFSTGGLPSMNLATCNPTDNATFSGTLLPDCSALASDIETCQAAGKLVTISLGGANGGVGFSSDAQGTAFAQTIWDLFLGGSSSTRPFGSAVLDGVDLDIEGGGGTGYAAFVTEIRSLASGASKQYYITAAPQCVFPDASLGSVINVVAFDAIYVQFYDNPCGLPFFETTTWNFGVWDNWARTTSPNPNVKVFLGAPAASHAAGTGYQDLATLSSYAVQMRQSFPSFGGVMLWDESQAYVNDRYDLGIKNALVAAGGTGFTFPACSAPTYVAGTAYSGGSKVSYDGQNIMLMMYRPMTQMATGARRLFRCWWVIEYIEFRHEDYNFHLSNHYNCDFNHYLCIFFSDLWILSHTTVICGHRSIGLRLLHQEAAQEFGWMTGLASFHVEINIENQHETPLAE
ncbi:carbohydrate-binding module family 5 protein [Lentinula edodes]|uniref:chitinase n=1 Tax=Lentinula edodes TaxID=5353 RepID=A0A1Q3EBZ9_LENED|nr:carbohydrate-binding module family 5 protein [Lentinula edodes]